MPTDRHVRWMRYQAPPDSRFEQLCYSSSVRGISSETMNTSIAYWGALLPANQSNTDREASASSYQDELADLAAQLPPRTTSAYRISITFSN